MPCNRRRPSKLVLQSPPLCNTLLCSTSPRIPSDAMNFAPTQRINFRRDGSARGRFVCEGGRTWVCIEGAEVDRSAMRACTPACPKHPPSVISIPDVTSPVADLHKPEPPLLALLNDQKEPYRVAVALVARSTDFWLETTYRLPGSKGGCEDEGRIVMAKGGGLDLRRTHKTEPPCPCLPTSDRSRS
ncbi:hypothetical protein EDD85DRAFT_108563 [Armillaria nabsnona]|nr:hypothetical protein EDD85DRAFT_108563 [Armillaria nabsnona]